MEKNELGQSYIEIYNVSKKKDFFLVFIENEVFLSDNKNIKKAYENTLLSGREIYEIVTKCLINDLDILNEKINNVFKRKKRTEKLLWIANLLIFIAFILSILGK